MVNLSYPPISKNIERFLVLLRKFDLNEFTENGSSVTKSEYQHLHNLWVQLSESDKSELLSGSSNRVYQSTLSLLLFYSLNGGYDWKTCTEDIKKYGKDISLTLSRFDSPVTLKNAHRTLVDLLYDRTSMFAAGQIRIAENIKQAAQQRVGDCARERLESWEELIGKSQHLSDKKKMTLINNYFNQQIQSIADNDTFEGFDYWQSPIETLVRGLGDCEDYAMAKYVSLRLLGLPAENMLIGIVYYPAYFEMHAVLFVFLEEQKDPYVLDNIPFKYLGYEKCHMLQLGYRMTMHELKPLWGINEVMFFEYGEGIEIKSKKNRPCEAFPRFGMVLSKSLQLLPELLSKG
jgi:predicted transglutaminase-like cysteine proteinase